MTVFYDFFERHSKGVGLKAHSTHYCPGCGHGLAHKYLAEAIEELGIQDRTIAISPVGCSVFLYYYFDVGNTQVAHGRAPAVGLGHKVANPEAVVISYQGDGDLASIGLAEIVSTAQMGIPMSVIFINNAIYGMTGGQMAPTTLIKQKTATCPEGRNPVFGQPMKMAELMSGLDGPIYVERVALFNVKERAKAKKAIKKAIQLQAENRGFAFVEVLAECPTHLGLTGTAAAKWVQDNMLPVFPLGTKKDLTVEPLTAWARPTFSSEKVLDIVGGSTKAVDKHCKGFPSHIAKRDIALKMAGAGGDGAQTAALLVTHAAINEGFDATHIPSYGPESRGGTSYADVHVAEGEVLSPASPAPHILVAFNAPSLAKFGPTVQKGGTVVYDSSTITTPPKLDESIKVVAVPFSQIAKDLGKLVVKNVVALGALQEATNIFTKDSFLVAIRQALKEKCALIPLNEEAFNWGVKSVRGS